MRVRCDI